MPDGSCTVCAHAGAELPGGVSWMVVHFCRCQPRPSRCRRGTSPHNPPHRRTRRPSSVIPTRPCDRSIRASTGIAWAMPRSNACIRGAGGLRVRSGSAICGACCGATSRTTGSCAGPRRRARSACSGSRPTTATATRFDLQGRPSRASGRRVTRYRARTAPSRSLADRVDGQPLNSPNDVVAHPDGSIWFTDPGYGILSTTRACSENRGDCRRASTAGIRRRRQVDADDRRADPAPNGLCFSPDYQRSCTSPIRRTRHRPATPRHPCLRRRRRQEPRLTGRLFHDMGRGGADGIRCDRDGNIWASAAGRAPATTACE